MRLVFLILIFPNRITYSELTWNKHHKDECTAKTAICEEMKSKRLLFNLVTFMSQGHQKLFHVP